MPPKKLKGKQKDLKTTVNHVEANPPPAIVVTHELPNPTQMSGFANQQESAWGQTGSFPTSAWGPNPTHLADTWPTAATTGQPSGSDDSSLGQSEILQPPLPHIPSALETIPELPTSTQFMQNNGPLSDIGESEHEDTEHWDNQHDPQQMWTTEGIQSRTLTATAAASVVNSPPPQPTISLADAAAAAQNEMRKQGKTTVASKEARKLEESKRHSVNPQHSASQEHAKAAHAVHVAPSHKPMSTASAAAAAMEATQHRNKTNHQPSTSQPQPAPGKTTWTYPKPFRPGARPPAHIQADPSWVHTGGNVWSNKYLASKSAPGVNWAQPVETPWPPRSHTQSHSQSQRSSQHRKHHSYTAYPYQTRQGSSFKQHQSWQGWGKDLNWGDYQESESDSDDDEEEEEEEAINIVGPGGDSWSWGQHPPPKQEMNQTKRGQKLRSNEYEGWNQGGRRRNEGKSPWQEQPNDDWGKTADNWNNGADGDWRMSGYDQDKGSGWSKGHEKASGWDIHRKPDKGGAKWPQGQDKVSGWDTEWSQDKNGAGWTQSQDKASRWDTDWNEDKGGAWSHGQDKVSEWDSNWNQDKGGARGPEFGKDKGSEWGEPHGQKPSTAAWGHSGDSWGTEAGGGAWGGTSNNEWHTKAPIGEVAGGTRSFVSPQERTQILNSFLPIHNQNPHGQGHRQNQAPIGKQVHNVGTTAQNARHVWEAQEDGWGSDTDEDMENPRRVRFSPKASVVWGGSPRSVPAKTAAIAQQSGHTTALNDPSNVRFVESNGAALECVSSALFGNSRLARERLYWLFPADKDERVARTLAWVQKMSFNLGTFSLMKFIQHRERGGLFVNANFKMIPHPQDHALDYLTFDKLQGTMDKTLQESVAFYDPAKFAMVFVFLPSQSGNSVAIWRRKINVPESARQKYRGEIDAIKKALRAPADYVVMLDELPRKSKPKTTTTVHRPGQLRKPVKTANAKATLSTSQAPANKQRKWWKFFLS